MKIRAFRPGDGADLIRLVRALAEYEHLKPPTPAAARRLVRDVGRRTRVLLAHEGQTAIAYAIYFFTYSSFLAKPTLYLEDLFVLPEYRRAGAGRKIFRVLRREARREKCGRMEWAVLDWNRPAIRFYEKLGAKPLSDWITYRMLL